MFPKQCGYRPKTWLGTNTVLAKPCLYRVQYLMENSVFAYYIHTLRVGTDPVFVENTDSLYFRKKQSLTGSVHTMYNVVQALNAFFEKFLQTTYRPCISRFSTRLPHGYRLTESKKCLYRLLPTVYIVYSVGKLSVLIGIEPVWACFNRYWLWYKVVSVALHGHLGVLLSTYYQIIYCA